MTAALSFAFGLPSLPGYGLLCCLGRWVRLHTPARANFPRTSLPHPHACVTLSFSPHPCSALLLKEALEEINKNKRHRYEAWRRRALSGVKAGRKLRAILLSTIIPAVVALHVSHISINFKRHVSYQGIPQCRQMHNISTVRVEGH